MDTYQQDKMLSSPTFTMDVMEAMSVPVVRFFRLPHGDKLPLPSYASAGAAGIDLRAALERPFRMFSGLQYSIPTGFAVAIPPGWEGQARSRSGWAKSNRIVVAHGVCTIDSDFRGEIMALLANFGDEAVWVEPGQRIMQLVIAKAPRAYIKDASVDGITLDAFQAETKRGAGGWGSTGL